MLTLPTPIDGFYFTDNDNAQSGITGIIECSIDLPSGRQFLSVSGSFVSRENSGTWYTNPINGVYPVAITVTPAHGSVTASAVATGQLPDGSDVDGNMYVLALQAFAADQPALPA